MKAIKKRINFDLETDSKVEAPQSTKKHEAQMEMRRKQLDKRRADEADKQRENMDRKNKQTRLVQRVVCSPAIVNNSGTLYKNR